MGDQAPYPKPLDPAIAAKVQTLDDDAREFFEERAGIRQYDGRFPRLLAERLAWQDLERWLAAHPLRQCSEKDKT